MEVTGVSAAEASTDNTASSLCNVEEEEEEA